MIGNDLVDLKLANIQSNWQRKGFLDKLFTPKEQVYILNADNPFETVWLLWSMKESAYKLYLQQGATRFFNPLKVNCEIFSVGIFDALTWLSALMQLSKQWPWMFQQGHIFEFLFNDGVWRLVCSQM